MSFWGSRRDDAAVGMQEAVDAELLCPIAAESPLAGNPDAITAAAAGLAGAGCPLALALHQRLQFERLLVELSAAFINLPTHEVDQQIELGLRQLGEFLGIDRSSFAEFSEDKRDMIVTHCYVGPGIAPYPPVIVDGQMPWYAQQVRCGQVLRFQRLPDDLPDEAVAERQYCIQNGLKSNLTIPLRVAGSLRCVITFATFHEHREWPDELVDRLRLISEIFAAALHRQRSEATSRQLQDQLARLGRATILGELAASIAHEIKQPLCAIISNAQAGQRMLARTDADLREVRETLRDIAADSRRANQIVEKIRSMLRGCESRRAPLDLNRAVREVAVLMQDQIQHRAVALSLELAATLPKVWGDRVQLQQVVVNLILNALDAMGEADVERREIVICTSGPDSSRVRLTVSDCGPGLPADGFDKLFEPFFTTKPDGLGVGLALCRTIVESHGGRISANADKASGAEFVVVLPAHETTT